MSKPFKPLLGEDVVLSLVQWPMLMPPKLDGIRVVYPNPGAAPLTRKLLPVPNPHINRVITDFKLSGLDGEIIVGEPTGEDVYNRTQSYVMSKSIKGAEQEFTLHVFDDFTFPDDPFTERFERARERVEALKSRFPLAVVDHPLVTSLEEMHERHAMNLGLGYEGSMLRIPHGRYKYGRSTAKEGILLKHKPTISFEAEIESYYEKLHNRNEATLDGLGHTKRSSHKEGKVPAGTLGGVWVREISPCPGRRFKVGIFRGLTAADLKKLWDERESLPGRKMKGIAMGSGEKDLPRHGRWVGWWDEADAALAEGEAA